MTTHDHCQCDFCSGVDCGADDPDKKQEEERQREVEKRNAILDEVEEALEKGLETFPYGVSRILEELRGEP